MQPVTTQNADPSKASEPSASGDAWLELIDALRPIGARVADRAWNGNSGQSRMETYRLLTMALAQGFIDYVYPDPRHPDWMPAYNTALNLLAPVPDYMYQIAVIDGAGTYRISGRRGSSLFVDMSIFTSFPSLGGQGPTAGRISLDSLHLGPDGALDLILSPERPANHSGDWFKLDTRAVRLQVRHASYDWLNEVDASLSIERLDVPAAKPRESAESIRNKIRALSVWAEGSVMWGINHIGKQRARGVINRLEAYDFSSVGGYDPKIQAYREGLFDLTPDEALIIDTEVPARCRYWSILLADDQYSSINWMYRQSSLNGHQARVDSDGRFRAVIAMSDPGVPNWLDTGGLAQGAIQLRWNESSSQPLPDAKKVALADIRHYLPVDTPTVTPAERDQALRIRARGAQRRRRW
jgi:hypothetical protein